MPLAGPVDTSSLTPHEPVGPSLRRVFRLRSNLGAAASVGDSGEGERRVVELASGELESPLPALNGARLVQGGADYLRIDTKGHARLDARYVFQLPSRHLLYFQSSGIRHVPPSYSDPQAATLLAQGHDIHPNRYYFRLKLILESDDPDPHVQDIVNKILIASAVRGPLSIVYDAYVVE